MFFNSCKCRQVLGHFGCVYSKKMHAFLTMGMCNSCCWTGAKNYLTKCRQVQTTFNSFRTAPEHCLEQGNIDKACWCLLCSINRFIYRGKSKCCHYLTYEMMLWWTNKVIRETIWSNNKGALKPCQCPSIMCYIIFFPAPKWDYFKTWLFLY